MGLTQVNTDGVKDDAVTLAKQAAGTDGQIITYDASGNPVAVGPGTDGQVLTSTGAGSPPAFEAIPTQISLANDANNRVITGTGSGLNGEANLTFDGSKLVIPTTGSNDANSNSDGAGFSSGSLHLRTRGATAGIAGTDYSNQIISNNGATVALEIFTTGSNSGTPVVFG